VTLNSGVTTSFTDSSATGQPVRFYRLQELQLPKLQLFISPTRQVVLRITGQLGRAYAIQASQNLKTWSVIGTVTLNADNSIDFTDINASNLRSRCYRLHELP